MFLSMNGIQYVVFDYYTNKFIKTKRYLYTYLKIRINKADINNIIVLFIQK